MSADQIDLGRSPTGRLQSDRQELEGSSSSEFDPDRLPRRRSDLHWHAAGLKSGTDRPLGGVGSRTRPSGTDRAGVHSTDSAFKESSGGPIQLGPRESGKWAQFPARQGASFPVPSFSKPKSSAPGAPSNDCSRWSLIIASRKCVLLNTGGRRSGDDISPKGAEGSSSTRLGEGISRPVWVACLAGQRQGRNESAR